MNNTVLPLDQISKELKDELDPYNEQNKKVLGGF